VSEYPYYEFLALDKLLTDKQRAELRKLSSRAEITATRFVNEYSYGDFRGSPEKLMEHLLRRVPLPGELGYAPADDPPAACSPRRRSRAAVLPHGRRLGDRDQRPRYISLYLDRAPDSYWVEADDRLAPMVQARSDLAADDLRLPYFAWLLGAQWARQDEEHAVADTEPLVPAGLGDLSVSLRAIADFLEIDKDLIAVAAETSPPLEEPANDGLAEWITALPAAEKDTPLTMVADGEGAQVQDLLLRRFRGSDTATTGRSGSIRTATGLRAAAESRAAERKKAQEQRRREEQARKAAARAAAYARRLDELAAEGETPWKQVDEMIATKKTSEYDRP
jgi:hypothetical protein